jgi:hypothetical protein
MDLMLLISACLITKSVDKPQFLKERNPFTPGTNLWNIETGVIADGKVDVDRSVEIGNNILWSMEGQQIDDYVFKKNKQVVRTSKNVDVSLWSCSVLAFPISLCCSLV